MRYVRATSERLRARESRDQGKSKVRKIERKTDLLRLDACNN
jgi:hypothetical protein